MKIEFRGKRLRSSEWVHGFYYEERGFSYITVVTDKPGEIPVHLNVPVRPKTVGQYTNLNDKNGKKIFDGDRCWNDYEEEYGIVSFDEGKFIFTFDNVCVDLFEVVDDLEVVNNIWDNPELLEVPK